MGKWLLIFIVSVFFGCWFFLFKLNGEQENEYENRTSGTGFFEKENEEKIFDKCNVFPNEGFLKTESGYYFDLFKFIRFIKKEQPDFELDINKKPYQTLSRYFKMKLNDRNECVLIYFNKNLSWNKNNKSYNNVNDVIKRGLINPLTNKIYDVVVYDRRDENFKESISNISVSFNSISVNNSEKLIKTKDLTWSQYLNADQMVSGKYILIPLVKYKNIKVQLTDREVSQGYINTKKLQPNITFVFEGIDNFGVDYTFQCNKIIFDLPKEDKLDLTMLLNLSIPLENFICTPFLGSNNDSLYRNYGDISFDIYTDDFNLNNLKLKIEQSIKFVDQFIIKEPRR